MFFIYLIIIISLPGWIAPHCAIVPLPDDYCKYRVMHYKSKKRLENRKKDNNIYKQQEENNTTTS